MKTLLLRTIKPLSLSIALAVTSFGLQSLSAAELTSHRSVYQTQQGNIAPKLNFSEPETGDIYLAFRQNAQGPYYFITKDNGVVTEPTPYDSIVNYTGSYPLPEFDTLNIPSDLYQFYQVMVVENSDVYDVNNWVGGAGSLNSLNFSVARSAEQDGDWNNDGWSDDDKNHDGYHDDDHNKDGYHDDDHDKDGHHDDDHDKDGYHDEESDGESDDDHDGESDDESDDDSDGNQSS